MEVQIKPDRVAYWIKVITKTFVLQVFTTVIPLLLIIFLDKDLGWEWKVVWILLINLMSISLYIVKVLLNWFYVARSINKTFRKKTIKFNGNSCWIKGDELNSFEEKKVQIHTTPFVSWITVKYNPWRNILSINLASETEGVKSSTSVTTNAIIIFDKENRKSFSILYRFRNESVTSAGKKVKEIYNLNDFFGDAKISVVNYELKNFDYVSDFKNRYSFGSYEIADEI